MNPTDNLQRSADDIMDHVVGVVETAKRRAAETADEIGGATRRTIHDAQGATEEAWTDAASRAKHLRAQVVVYLREQPLNTVIVAVATGFLLSLVLLFFRRILK
jgi:ElaB/YqjD/DUF883 family membrane-anchored ribosome-binding protein